MGHEKIPGPKEETRDKIHDQDESKALVKSLNPEDLVIVQPTKPMSSEEIRTEMEKQGMRPATPDELLSFGGPRRITPRGTDIIIEADKKEKPKRKPGELPE